MNYYLKDAAQYLRIPTRRLVFLIGQNELNYTVRKKTPMFSISDLDDWNDYRRANNDVF